MAAATGRVAAAPARREAPVEGLAGMRALLAQPLFRRLLLVAALVIGSHALNDGFAVIRWREAGIGAGTISLLWSESVRVRSRRVRARRPMLLRRFSPAQAALLAASTGILPGP